LLWWYGAPIDADTGDPKVIRACNPASWISINDLQQQRRDPALDDTDFRRHHLNQWPPAHHTALSARHADPHNHAGAKVDPEQFAELFRELRRRYPQTQ
jgi:hypothetical protein